MSRDIEKENVMKGTEKRFEGPSEQLEQITLPVELPDLNNLQDLDPPEILEKNYPIPLQKYWKDIEELCKLTRYRLIFNNCGGLPAPAILYDSVLGRLRRKFNF